MVQKAEYTPQAVVAYRGNPLIEALPKRLENDGFYRYFSCLPSISADDRNGCKADRLDMAEMIDDFIRPFPSHLQLYNKLYSLMKRGYKSRNPLQLDHWTSMPAKRKALVDGVIQVNTSQPNMQPLDLPGGRARLNAALIGCSGLGKSTIVKRLLAMFPKVIFHGCYNHRRLNLLQLTSIYVEADKSFSIKDICLQIFQGFDRYLHTNYEHTYGKGSAHEMIAAVATLANAHALGLLVLDELQELAPTKSGGTNAIISFLLRLTNCMDVPILMVGTPNAIPFMSKELRHIRRSSGIPEWRPLARDSEDWNGFTNCMWPYQYTLRETILTDNLSDSLHSLTMGIPDFAITLYKETQKHLIAHNQDGNPNNITPELLENIAIAFLTRELKAIRLAAKHNPGSPELPSDLPSHMPSMRTSKPSAKSEGPTTSTLPAKDTPDPTAETNENKKPPQSADRGVLQSKLRAVAGNSTDAKQVYDSLADSKFVAPAMEFIEGAPQ